MDNYNTEFIKVQGDIDEIVCKIFEDNANKLMKKRQKTIAELYNELYNKVDLPSNFENNYQAWLDKEIWGVFD